MHIRGRFKGERASENERRRVLRDVEDTARKRERARERGRGRKRKRECEEKIKREMTKISELQRETRYSLRRAA